MTIVVSTPTGNIGRHVVRALLNADKQLRLIARNPDKLDADTRTRTEVIQGSINDSTLLTRSFDNAEAVFWCVPQSNTPENIRDYYLDFAKAAATAIQKTGISRVVAVSSGGKGLAKNAGPISALHAMEDELKATGAATRYLRCGYFMENFLWSVESIAHQSIFFYPFPEEVAIPMVAACDIGVTAVEWLKRGDWTGQDGVGVHGPEDLSLNQVAEIFSEVLGKTVRFQRIPPEACRDFLLQHGSSRAFIQGYLNMCEEVANGIYRAEPRTPETTTPTTLRQWAKAVMLPVVNKLSY